MIKKNIKDYVEMCLFNTHNDVIKVRDEFNSKLDYYTRVKNSLINNCYGSRLIKLYKYNIKFMKKAIKYLNKKVVNKND